MQVSLTLHNVNDKDGKATANYVVQSGNDFYAATIDDTTGAVTLNTAKVTYNDSTNGVRGAEQDNQLVKV
jgi:flagellin